MQHAGAAFNAVREAAGGATRKRERCESDSSSGAAAAPRNAGEADALQKRPRQDSPSDNAASHLAQWLPDNGPRGRSSEPTKVSIAPLFPCLHSNYCFAGHVLP
jgi:hypothetical protein